MNDVEAKSSPSTEAHAAKFGGPHPVFLRFRFNLNSVTFSFCKPPYMHLRERRGATVAFRLHRHERYHEIFVGKDVMNVDREGTAAKLHGVSEKADDLIVAFVVA